MFKRVFAVKILAFLFFGSAVAFSNTATAFEELPVVEVPVQDWAKDPVKVEQIVPSVDAPPVPEISAPTVTVDSGNRPSIQIESDEAIVIDVTEDKPKNESGGKNPSNTGSTNNRPVLQAPTIEIPEQVTTETPPAGKNNKKNDPVISYDRPVVQPLPQEQIVVPDYADLNQDTTLDFGSSELPESGEVSQVEVSTPSAPTPNPLWGMVGLGLLGAAGSATVLHFMRN